MLELRRGAHGDDAEDFVVDVHAALRDERPLAEAVRAARDALHRRAGVARLAPTLYGDGALCTTAASRAGGDDVRRQVTMLSYDLVGSTALLNAIGDERYADLLHDYHVRCRAIVHGRGGHADEPKGDDGVMCYFGYPQAREDGAAQALCAALELVDAVRALGLSVRIGVGTGDVVVRNAQPVGAAIHYAARLRVLAEPGAVLVSESTRAIVRDRFVFRSSRPAAPLKGFDREEPIHEVVGHATAGAVAADRSPPQPTAFIGRVDEMAALAEQLAAAGPSGPRVVRVVGDAGIGKTRLVAEFRRASMRRGVEVFFCRCGPDHRHSAFHPLIDALRDELRVGAAEPPRDLLARLNRLVSWSGSLGDDDLALLGDLLGIGGGDATAVRALAPEQRRQRTLDLLATLGQRRLQGRAGCMIVEDVHWIDPSTAEFIDHFAEATAGAQLLIVLTTRPDAQPAWQPRRPVVDVALKGLSPLESRALVRATVGHAVLPPETVHAIADRGDGIPLFIEESTRMAVDLAAGGEVLARDAGHVPSSLLDLLTARLDRLGPAKAVAQVAGAIGRGFPQALLHAVLAHASLAGRVADVDGAVATLVRSGMLVARGTADGPRWSFRHSLMRDAAYRSLLDRDRMRLHRAIADVLTQAFGDLAEREPALLAVHHEASGDDAAASQQWERAARVAASRSAHAETAAHAGRALAALRRLPGSDERDRRELRLQMLLAARWIALDGYGADRVERAYARALELAAALNDDVARLRIVLGLAGYHFMRADFDRASACAEDGLQRAEHAGAVPLAQAQWAAAVVSMHRGEMHAAVQQMDACLARCEQLSHLPAAVQDPAVMCLCYSAWSMWQLGRADEALRRALAVVERARQMQHPFSLGEALGFCAAVQHFRGDDQAALASAEAAVAVCEESGFSVWLAHARIMRGRVRAALGDANAAIVEMKEAFDAWAATGAVVTIPFYLAMRAEALEIAGRPDEGLALVRQGLAVVEKHGERYWEPELRRLHGRLMLADANRIPIDRREEAERWLLDAVACADRRGMRALALRAAVDLAELRLADDRPGAALDILHPAFDAIAEGRGTRDLQRAEALLLAATRQLAITGAVDGPAARPATNA